MMLAIELLLTFAVACFFLHEQYTAREFVGVAVILFGMIVLTSGNTHSQLTAMDGKDSLKISVLPSNPSAKAPQPFKTSTPGKTLPSIHSRNAPPAVEI
jgi:hypothetical protein